jgi:LmbE family N-acetylglucosaminyl deacetylase
MSATPRERNERLHVVGVGAHPDDVAIGAGGVIASYVKRGHRATILTVTYGETVRPPGPQQEEARRIRFPPPWDTHADHRNLSATMKDVMYYVGHAGMAFDAPPCHLRSAWMYSIEANTEELHQPDLLFDVTEVMDQKVDSLTGTRPIFDQAGQHGMIELVQVSNRFWGLRCGVRYAEPLFQSWGSMRLAQLTRDHYRVTELPLLPP